MAGELELLCAPCGPPSFWKWVMETVSNFSLFEVAPAVQEVGRCKCVPSTDRKALDRCNEVDCGLWDLPDIGPRSPEF
jgi:hypothetical protein